MQLTPNFTLLELTKTSVRGHDNTPPPHVVENLKALAVNVLQPVRNHFGAPVVVNSGYRSPAVNAAVGGSKTSDHMHGEAADIEVVGVSNYELAKYIHEKLPHSQVILECYKPGGDPNAGWVHVSYKRNGPNKEQALTFDGKQYLNGLIA